MRRVRERPTPPPPPAPPLRQPLPPLVADPWAWLVAGSVGVTLWTLRGSRPGVAVMDDFLFLRRALLEGGGFFDGGGLDLYWRPLARQAWFGGLGGLIVDHPGVMTGLHSALLAVAGLTLYAAWRHRLPRPAAAFAASAPVLLEASRTVLAWPSAIQELGALVGLAFAFAAAALLRLAAALVAALAALLCKETAAALVMLLPCTPGPLDRPRRLRLAAGAAGLLAAWSAAWLLVHRGAALALADVTPAAAAAMDPAARLGRALAWSARDALDLTFVPSSIGAPLAFVVLAALVLGIARTRARTGGVAPAARVSAFGVAWFVLAAAPAAWIVPAWASYRSLLPAAGLALALAPWLARPAGVPLAIVAGCRVAALLLTPLPPADIADAAPGDPAVHDYARHARIARIVHATRAAFVSVPGPVRGVTWHQFPRDVDFAFEGSAAFQVWAGDSGVRWQPFARWRTTRDTAGVALLQFQPADGRVIALEPGAMVALLAAADARQAGRAREALATLDIALRRGRDPRAGVFLAQVQIQRAAAFRALGQLDSAAAAAQVALARHPGDPNVRVLLAQVRLAQGDAALARELLAEQVRRYPGDAEAVRMLHGLTGLPALR